MDYKQLKRVLNDLGFTPSLPNQLATYEQKIMYLENTAKEQEAEMCEKNTTIKKVYHTNMGLGQVFETALSKAQCYSY